MRRVRTLIDRFYERLRPEDPVAVWNATYREEARQRDLAEAARNDETDLIFQLAVLEKKTPRLEASVEPSPRPSSATPALCRTDA